jgi:hypothetical protein
MLEECSNSAKFGEGAVDANTVLVVAIFAVIIIAVLVTQRERLRKLFVKITRGGLEVGVENEADELWEVSQKDIQSGGSVTSIDGSPPGSVIVEQEGVKADKDVTGISSSERDSDPKA